MTNTDAYKVGYTQGFAEGVKAMQKVVFDLSRDTTTFENLAASLKQSHSGACLDAATPIERLGLTRRITWLLARNNIVLVRELLGYGTEDLLDLSSFGPRTLAEVEAALAAVGESLVQGRLAP